MGFPGRDLQKESPTSFHGASQKWERKVIQKRGVELKIFEARKEFPHVVLCDEIRERVVVPGAWFRCVRADGEDAIRVEPVLTTDLVCLPKLVG